MDVDEFTGEGVAVHRHRLQRHALIDVVSGDESVDQVEIRLRHTVHLDDTALCQNQAGLGIEGAVGGGKSAPRILHGEAIETEGTGVPHIESPPAVGLSRGVHCLPVPPAVRRISPARASHEEFSGKTMP